MSKGYSRSEDNPSPVLSFYTPAEIAAMARDEPDWIVRGLPAIGAITEVDGKIKPAGKTTEENSAGEWSAAMAPRQDLAATGRAIIVLRRDRKGGGDAGDSGCGSSQASGDVDITLALLLVQAVLRAAGNLVLHPEQDSEPENAKLDCSWPASGTAVRTEALDGAR